MLPFQEKLQQKIRQGESVTLAVKIVPNSQQNKLVGIMAHGLLKIKIAAPPEKGKANETLIQFLAEIWDIPENRIEIVRGHTSPQKIVRLLPL